MKPNLRYLLVPSYNGRADGSSLYNSAKDQRRVNCYYDIAANKVHGNVTPYLAKRPGPGAIGGAYGVDTQTSYLIAQDPALATGAGALPWVIAKDGSAHKVLTPTAHTIFTDVNYFPYIVDRGVISSARNMVVQFQRSVSHAQRVFYANVYNSWTEISDANFTGLIHRGKLEIINGYGFILASNGNAYNSTLNDLTAWGAASFFPKQTQVDIPIGLMKYKTQILLCGDETTEVTYVSDTSPSPLQRIPTQAARIGLYVGVEGPYYCELYNRLWFVGTESGRINSIGLYTYNGSTFERITNSIVSRYLQANAPVGGVYPFAFYGKLAVALQKTSIRSAQPTTYDWLMFFPDTGEVFEWTSDEFGPSNDGTYFVGCGVDSDLIFNFGQTLKDEDGDATPIEMMVQFELPQDADTMHFIQFAGLLADTESSASNVVMSFSKDDGQTWETVGTFSLTQSVKRLPALGMYTEKLLVRLEHNGSGFCRLREFYARIS